MTAARSAGRPGGRRPLYRTVAEGLLERIRAGEFGPGDRLPTETDLAREWEVNRLTVRQAVGELARAGHVVVRQGSGTYVAERAYVYEFALPRMSFADTDTGSPESAPTPDREDRTETRVAVVTEQSTTAADGLGEPGPFVRIEALTVTGGRPFMVSSYWVVAARFPGLVERVDERVALSLVLRERYGTRLRNASRTLAAGLAGGEDAALLDVAPGSPVMVREGVNVDDTGRPTLFVRRRLRGDRVRFTLSYDLT